MVARQTDRQKGQTDRYILDKLWIDFDQLAAFSWSSSMVIAGLQDAFRGDFFFFSWSGWLGDQLNNQLKPAWLGWEIHLNQLRLAFAVFPARYCFQFSIFFLFLSRSPVPVLFRYMQSHHGERLCTFHHPAVPLAHPPHFWIQEVVRHPAPDHRGEHFNIQPRRTLGHRVLALTAKHGRRKRHDILCDGEKSEKLKTTNV